MAVTLAQLAVSLRIQADVNAGVDPAAALILTRLQGVADAHIALLVPTAPDAVKDEITVRFVGYMYDQPTAAAGTRFAHAWRNSGAAALASRWVVRRAGVSST